MGSSMAKRILLIVEGDNDEVAFFKRLFGKCFRKTEYCIYRYSTTIHTLAQELYKHYPEFEEDEIDIQLVMQSLEKDKNKKDLLQGKYTDVYLIFDFEPQHDHTHFDMLKRMINYFSDSTAQGKLYLNYPMMQSYKHFLYLPDNDFYNRIVNYNQICNYKKVVGEESSYTDINKYEYHNFYSLAVHHMRKANYILSGKYALPVFKDYLEFDYGKIFDAELELFQNEKSVSVLNTCIFALCDYAPKRFFDFVNKKASELSI